MAGQDWFEKDFYAALGVPSNASEDEIKKAYRKLARQYHPDVNPGDSSAEKRFKDVGEAYGVLSDAEQRRQYDAVRAMARGGARFTAGGAPGGGGAGFEDLLSNLFGGGQFAPGGAPGGRNVRFTTTPTSGPAGATGPGSPIFEDLFNGMFTQPTGAGAGTGYRAPRGPRRGEDLTTEATITFRQAAEGALLTLRVDDPRHGPRTIRTRLPAGVRDNQKIVLRGKGSAGDPGAEPGDLEVRVHVESHPLFTLDGHDLRISLPVTFAEATLGAQVEVPTLDGSTVRVKVPAGTSSGKVLRVRGKGVVGGSKTGDLLVTVAIAVPQKVDGATRQALEALQAATAGQDPRADLADVARGWAQAHGTAATGT
ncbi:MAG: DnaJ C-terminal domain-containing protein [Kineosporiaceae bacterium]